MRVAVCWFCDCGCGVPGADAALGAASPEGLGRRRGGEGCDVLLVAVDDAARLGGAFGKIVEISGEGEGDDEVVRAGRPDDSDLMVGNADRTFFP